MKHFSLKTERFDVCDCAAMTVVSKVTTGQHSSNSCVVYAMVQVSAFRVDVDVLSAVSDTTSL